MTWLLDTNVISEPVRPRPSPLVLASVDAQPVTSLDTASLAFAEIPAGIQHVADTERRHALARWLSVRLRPFFADRVLDADEAVWGARLEILGRLKSANRTVPVIDPVFAALAQRHGLVVVTRNVRHFAGTGVRVLNPWLDPPTPATA